MELIANIFKANTDIVSRAINDVAPEDWFRKPGDDSNHLLWVMGHLVVHRGMTLKLLGGQWESPWGQLFARGAERVADEKYPSAEELKTEWQKISADLVPAVRNASEDVLGKAVAAGSPSFDGKVSGNITLLAFHDAYHAGQVGYLRKWLGYGQTVG